jgi:hypothetical protein
MIDRQPLPTTNQGTRSQVKKWQKKEFDPDFSMIPQNWLKFTSNPVRIVNIFSLVYSSNYGIDSLLVSHPVRYPPTDLTPKPHLFQK